MKIKKSILSGLLALGVLSVSAQNTAEPKTEYVFNPHFYVQLQGGGQYTLGEISFGKLLSPNIQIAGGYQFTPIVGSRLAINGAWSKGGSEINGVTYKWGWNYIAPSIDATFNLSNFFCGYNPYRKINIGVFAGLGLDYAFSNGEAKDANNAIINDVYGPEYEDASMPLEYLWSGSKIRPFVQAGVTADYYISDAISVGLELNANTLNDRYNSKKAKNWDWYFNALVGVKVNLGTTHSTRTIPAPEPEIRYVDRVVEKVVEKVVETPTPAPVPTPAPAKVEPLRHNIYFAINSSKISTKESVKVKEIAEYLNKYLEAKVELSGYADAGTGNNTINDRLAAQRAAAVVKALKEQGIAANRISSDSKGSRVQPFDINDNNRVVICIAE